MASQPEADTVAGAASSTNVGVETPRKEQPNTTAGATAAVDMNVPAIPLPDRTPAPTSASLDVPSSSPQLTRTQTEALGPATDAPIAHPTSAPTGPTLNISLMLTTGARHPYKVDERYLRNRKVEARTTGGDFDPRELSGYKLKELIWTDWRNEWDPRPASPSSIRLILMGRMIEDKGVLKDFPFKMDTTNVVHMTVKPADLIDDDDAAAKSTGKGGVLRAQDGEDSGAGCRCSEQFVAGKSEKSKTTKAPNSGAAFL
ncbi:unnamed protein product [Zymoseptoria tritici ST99CH_1A5]|uniref:UBL3-like ubiquitin domain-containing protein n=1 Tax=Zymoseptoria tritici ST99CH_1A5 TaxID=1276529 RepID=A0A1Y6LZ86_ZYMTR|nr:unnamed protein product [Zymoseptoria tritici ST99CH_1A5]